MKFNLDFKIDLEDGELMLTDALAKVDEHRDSLKDPASWSGQLVITVNNDEMPADYDDPTIRLAAGWLRKVPWVISGDTETVALRNSEQCFAFVPTGDGVEISFFEGSEAEIEEYVFEPTNVMLDDFAKQSIGVGERVLELVRSVDESLLQEDEDCKDLVISLEEAQKAWHDYELHNRR